MQFKHELNPLLTKTFHTLFVFYQPEKMIIRVYGHEYYTKRIYIPDVQYIMSNYHTYNSTKSGHNIMDIFLLHIINFCG